MLLKINRFKNIFDGTLGKFYLVEDNELFLKGYTLEPMGEDTVKPNQDRRIPAGLYSVAWHKSPKFKRILPLLYNELVSKDRYILIHAGNYPKHTEGCILLGDEFDEKGVYHSVKILDEFIKLVKDKEFVVEISNECLL